MATVGIGRAGQTNYVFLAQNSLRGATLALPGTGHGKLQNLNSQQITAALLGPYTNSLLAIAVSNMESKPTGPTPTIRLVAYDPSQGKIVASLVEFANPATVYIQQSSVNMTMRGTAVQSLVSASLGAYVTLKYQDTTPLSVQMQPTGSITVLGTNGVDSATVTVTGSDANQAPVTVALTGRGVGTTENAFLNVAPTSLGYGDVSVGSTNILGVGISNIGNMTATVSSVTLTGSINFAISNAPTQPFKVAPGQTQFVSVRYAPTDVVTDTTQLQLATNVAGQSLLNVDLTGTGVSTNADCLLTAGPDPLGFGDVLGDGSSQLAFAVNNVGNVNCTVKSVVLTGSASFTTNSVPSLPATVAPKGRIVISINYNPSNGQPLVILGGNLNGAGQPTLVSE